MKSFEDKTILFFSELVWGGGGGGGGGTGIFCHKSRQKLVDILHTDINTCSLHVLGNNINKLIIWHAHVQRQASFQGL